MSSINLYWTGGLLLACILLSSPAVAQVPRSPTGAPNIQSPPVAREITGTVKDSTGVSVPYANVNLCDTGRAILAYTTTDANGGYVLHLPANLPAANTPSANAPSANTQATNAPSANAPPPAGLYLEARCIGFKTQRKTFAASTGVIDFTLAISPSELQSVVVRNSRPKLHTSGDTLSYSTSDFASAQDRVIGDVIKRLPGISVASDGTISYNNKPVSGVYLGGDNLLDDKYTIATNNIPQGAVDQVQVIDNHQPIKVLQNKVTSDDVALNLTFKKSAKLRPLGQETVGAGLPGNYYVDLNAMFLKDRYKAINYLKGNNTGEDLQQELVSHNIADYKQRIGNDPPATVLSLGTVNDPALSRDRYFFDRSGLLNLNNLVNLKNGLQLRINASYLHDMEKQDYSQNASVFLPGDTVKYTETQHNRFHPDLLHTQFTLNVNKDKYYLNDALLLDDNRLVDYSDLNTNGSMVHQVFKDDQLSFSNEFDAIRPIRANKLIELYSYISHQSEPENRTISPGYNAELFNSGAAYAQLVQQVDVPAWYANNYVSFKLPGDLGTKSFKTGFSVQSRLLTSDLSVQQLNNVVNPALDSAVNHLSWTRKRAYAEAAYDIPGDDLKANLTIPLTLQQIDYSDKGYALRKGLQRLYFNPQMSLKYKTGIENFLTLLFSYRNQTGGIEDLYHGYILKDYRTLYANNADLTLRQNLLAAAGYNYRKALTLFFFSINMSYNHIGANNIASEVVTNNFQQQVVLPYPNRADTWTMDATFGKYSFPLRTTFSAELKWQDNQVVQLQNGAFLPFSTTVGTLSGSATTKLNDHLNFSYHIAGTQINTHSSAEASANQVDQLQQQAEIDYIPSAGLQFKLAGEDYFTHSQGNPDLKYFFADASAKYRIKQWKIDLQLEAANFLDVKTYKALYLSANTLTSSSYMLPGRIILLKAMFNL